MAGTYEVLPNFRFILRIEGVFNLPLKSIRPFTKENEYEQIEEGGLNDFVYMKRKHVTKPHTIQIERYLTEDFYDPVPNGTAFVLPLLLFVGGNNGQDFDLAPRRTYVFFGAQVLNKEIGGFDAEKSGLLTETVTIAYHQMYFIDTPGETESTPWTFEKNGLQNVYAKDHLNIPGNDVKMQDLVDLAESRTWHFGEEGEYLGNGVRYSGSRELDIPANKRTLMQAESTAKANTWHFAEDSNNYLGNGVTHSHSEVVEDRRARPVYNESTGMSSVTQTAAELYAKLAKSKTWHFADKEYLGNKQTHFNTLPSAKYAGATTSELTMAEKKAEENTWRFAESAATYTGNGKMHATHIEGEKTLNEAVAFAKENTWPNKSHALKAPELTKENFLKS